MMLKQGWQNLKESCQAFLAQRLTQFADQKFRENAASNCFFPRMSREKATQTVLEHAHLLAPACTA